MELLEFDVQGLWLHGGKELARKAAHAAECTFMRHFERTQNGQIALQETKRIMKRNYDFECSLDEQGATFASPYKPYGVRMEQDECSTGLVFAVVQI